MRGFGGVLAVELAGGYKAADSFIGRLVHFRRSASLGGVESLAVHPAAMWRGMLSEQDIAASGVPASLVRLAAGTEDTTDLVADALAAADAIGLRLIEGPPAGAADARSPKSTSSQPLPISVTWSAFA